MRQAMGADTSGEGSFATFFADHRASALRQAQRLVADRAAAEDVVAEAFARMWARWDGGAIDAPAHYLSRVIRNAATDHYRRLGRERDTIARAAGTTDAQRETIVGAVEARAVVSGLLAQLAPGQRRVVSLRYLRDLSEAQTARSLGVSVGTVKSSTSRSLHRLRELHEVESAA